MDEGEQQRAGPPADRAGGEHREQAVDLDGVVRADLELLEADLADGYDLADPQPATLAAMAMATAAPAMAADPGRIQGAMTAGLADVQAKYATWQLGNLVDAIDRHLGDAAALGVPAAERPAAVDALARAVVDPGAGFDVVQLTGHEPVEVPAALLRRDGRPVFRPHEERRFATASHLETEAGVGAYLATGGAQRVWEPAPIRSVGALVRSVAPLCRLLRDEVVDQLGRERTRINQGQPASSQPFTGLAADWRTLLFPGASDREFADGYAQTVTFALLLARSRGVEMGRRSIHTVGDALGASSALMGRALQLLTDHVEPSFRVSLGTLLRVVSAIDWDKVRGGRRDTYLYLYEEFLEVYDDDLRKSSGSYYTLVDVAEQMVRLTDDVVRTRLQRPEGLGAPGVSVIDPAAGTGTFLLRILEIVHDRLAGDGGPGAAREAVADLATRLFGFELQMGPHAGRVQGRTWASFFNDRQLYALGRIAAVLRDLPGDTPEREALVAAFGKTLEHHNLFCSYKGEGTGPVRSIFHNHVLRPERCSVEGNPWGADGGSGGYADALERLRHAHDYKQAPTDLADQDGTVITVNGRSAQVSRSIVTSWIDLQHTPDAAYIATGDAATTDLPDGSATLVVTDPPYVDNVHYSELADFFHAWMRPIRPHTSYPQRASTRDDREVQNRAASGFHTMIADVWRECRRVLHDDGLLAFSFHQARTSGWAALMASLADAGFVATAIRPVVAEVTTSLTKTAAIEPNRIDVIVVCRKASAAAPRTPAQARADVMRGLTALHRQGIDLGDGDVRSAVRASVLAQGTRAAGADWDVLSAHADTQADRAVAAFTASSDD